MHSAALCTTLPQSGICRQIPGDFAGVPHGFWQILPGSGWKCRIPQGNDRKRGPGTPVPRNGARRDDLSHYLGITHVWVCMEQWDIPAVGQGEHRATNCQVSLPYGSDGTATLPPTSGCHGTRLPASVLRRTRRAIGCRSTRRVCRRHFLLTLAGARHSV